MSKKKDISNIISTVISDPEKYAKSISIDELVNLLKDLSHYYYNTDESLVPDSVFDILKDTLEERDPKNKYLEVVGTPVTKDKVSLPYPMASLNKIKPETKVLEAWLKDFGTGPYVLSDKIDGVSGLLYKKNNKFRLFTRGDSTSGQDITHLIPYLLGGRYQPGKIPDGTAIRGEIIMSKDTFKTVKDQYKNARNTVAGLVNSKNFSVELAKITEFIGYSVVHPKFKQEEQMKKLKEWGFPTVTYKVYKKNELTYDALKQYLQDRRKSSKYEVDGIVVIDSSEAYDAKVNNPTYGFAFKMVLDDQVADVVVKDITWSVTRLGYLKPVVNIEPVNLVGVTIKNATAHNAKFIVDNKLGPGAVIKIVRSGDVIPYIMKVIKPADKAKMPTVPYKWNASGVDLVVQDVHGASKNVIIIKTITHFFKVLGVKFISEGIVTKLVDAGYTTVKSVITADPDKLADIDGIGDKLIKKIYDGMKTAFETTDLQTLMAASAVFGRGFGTKKIKPILDMYPNIMNEKWTKKEIKEKVLEIQGFEEVTAEQFSNNFDNFLKFFDELTKIQTINIAHLKKQKAVKKKGLLFDGKKVVFTGFRNQELEDFIVNNSGSVTTSVSINTILVVYSDTTSGKYEKAVELNIPVLTQEEFKKKYKL